MQNSLDSSRSPRVVNASAVRAASCLAFMGMMAACGGGGGDSPTGVGAAASVTLSVGSVTLTTIGGTQVATAVVKDAKGNTLTSASVTWTSDSPTIASVAASGNSATITAVGTGATVIRVRTGTIGADIPVQVLGVRSMQVSPVNASIRAGDSQPFSATLDSDPGVSTSVTWTTGSAAVATVAANGIVTGVAPGTTTIRATSVADPRISATGNIVVTAARSVTIAPATASIATGQQQTLVATLVIESGLNTGITWRSSAPAVATVTQSGVVTGVAFGTTTITAIAVADSMLRGTATVNVVPIIRNVTVSPTTASLLINNTAQLASTVTAEGNLSTTVTWRSANLTVATVSATGLVTAVGLGSTSITALSTVDTTKRASATVTVNPRPIVVAIVQRVVGLNPSTSMTLTANVTGDPGVNTAVTWSSSTPSVASINQSGVVSALSPGSTLVTATSQADNSKRDTVTVNVIQRLATTWTASRLGGGLFDDMISVAAFNPTTAFAINSINGGVSGGDIYRWNGLGWALSASGTAFGTKFLAVHGSGGVNAIAVGTNGKIARFNGFTWTAMTSGTTQNLRSVWVESVSSAFAVGAGGTTLRFTNDVWAPIASGSTAQLNGVWSNNGIAFAVGNSGEVLRFNGTAWAKQTVPFSDDLNSVSGVAGGAVTAVGNFGGILRYTGTTWSLINSNGVLDNFYSVAGTTANNDRMYVGGDNGLYQIDGTTLTRSNIPLPVSVYSVSLDGSNVVWTSGQRGALQRFTGGSWETLNFAPDLLDVWTTSASNSWAVAEFGYIYRWTGGATWTRQTSPSLAHLYAVWAPSSSDAFAGGDNGTMLRWNGTAWTSMTFPSTARVFGLWGSSATNVFAVTDIGEILRFNGTTWTLQTTAPGGATLLSVYGVSASEVYATGTGGLVLRYNGTTWSTFSAPDAVTTLFGVWMSGSNNIVTVGANQSGLNGFAFMYGGTTWQPMTVTNAVALTSVWGASAFDLYATGDAGTMWRYTGTAWSAIATGTTDLLWAISGAPDATGGAFAVGINSTMVTGSSTGAFTASAMSGAPTSTGSLGPSLAAQSDRKASNHAAKGAERRDRGIRGSAGALQRAAQKRAAARAAQGRRGR